MIVTKIRISKEIFILNLQLINFQNKINYLKKDKLFHLKNNKFKKWYYNNITINLNKKYNFL
jgi:hypothetical protein